MNKTLSVLAAGALTASLCLPAPSSAASADVSVFRFTADAAHGDFSTDCPNFYVPPEHEVTCTDYFIVAAEEADVIGGGSIAPPKVPVPFMYVEKYTLHLHPDLTVDGDLLASGFTIGDAVQVSVDTQHFTSASAAAVVNMSDGSTLDVTTAWAGYGPRFLYGVNGTALNDTPVHFHDTCLTANNHWHQIIKNARATATINGVVYPMLEVSPPFSEGLFDSSATIETAHGMFMTVRPHADCP